MDGEKQSPFRTCSRCGESWDSREGFLADPEISLIGYQVNFRELELGLLLFTHSCNTTISLHAEVFTDIYDGPVFEERRTGSDECPGYCLQRSVLRSCPVKCECAYVREVLDVINGWPKRDSH